MENDTSSLLFAGVMVVGFGLVFLILWLRQTFQTGASRGWPVTNGQVVYSSIQEGYSRRGGVNYYPAVVYQYQVGGYMLQGRQITVGSPMGYGSMGRAQNRASQYPVGSIVPVYYNPSNPNEAVLERRSPIGWVYLVFVVGVLGCGGCILVSVAGLSNLGPLIQSGFGLFHK